jgi:hypothetical protein
LEENALSSKEILRDLQEKITLKELEIAEFKEKLDIMRKNQ